MGLFEGLEVTGVLLLLICLIFGLYWVYLKKYNFWVGKPIPSDSPIPIFGNTLGLLMGKIIHETDLELYKKYGRVFGSYLGVNPVIFVAEPELIKSVLVKDFSTFPSRRSIVTNDPLVDNMVSIVKGDDQWRNIRNTMTPAFSSGRLKKMLPLICDCARLTVENFEKYSRNGEPVDCKRIYGCFTLDVIAIVAFGTKLDSLNDPDNKFVQHAKKVFSVEISWKFILTLLAPKIANGIGLKFFPQETMDFFKELILEIVKRRETNNEVQHDFLQIMIDSLKEVNETSRKDTTEISNESTDLMVQTVEDIKRKRLTEDEFLAQTILFFLAGYDTTATVLNSVTYYLATNPECQRIALKEADKIWEGRENLDNDALSEAKYIGAVIDEALRLTPPATRIERSCVKDYKLGDTGVTLPAGMVVEIPVYALHHDPEFFPDPENFKPERFMGEGKTNIANSYTYLPFGAGPRNCIAMRLALQEAKMCLLYVLKHFEFSPSDKTKIPMQYLRTGLLQPKDVILHVHKRT